jgi:hypothetical protein
MRSFSSPRNASLGSKHAVPLHSSVRNFDLISTAFMCRGMQKAMDFGDMAQLFQMIQQQNGNGGSGGVGNPMENMMGHAHDPFQQQGQGPFARGLTGGPGKDEAEDELFSPGIQVWRDPRNKEMTVIGVPSKSCGIKEGDIIKCVDGRKVKEWSVQKCLFRLSGPANSKVEIVTKKGAKVRIFWMD